MLPRQANQLSGMLDADDGVEGVIRPHTQGPGSTGHLEAPGAAPGTRLLALEGRWRLHHRSCPSTVNTCHSGSATCSEGGKQRSASPRKARRPCLPSAEHRRSTPAATSASQRAWNPSTPPTCSRFVLASPSTSYSHCQVPRSSCGRAIRTTTGVEDPSSCRSSTVREATESNGEVIGGAYFAACALVDEVESRARACTFRARPAATRAAFGALRKGAGGRERSGATFLVWASAPGGRRGGDA